MGSSRKLNIARIIKRVSIFLQTEPLAIFNVLNDSESFLRYSGKNSKVNGVVMVIETAKFVKNHQV